MPILAVGPGARTGSTPAHVCGGFACHAAVAATAVAGRSFVPVVVAVAVLIMPRQCVNRDVGVTSPFATTICDMVAAMGFVTWSQQWALAEVGPPVRALKNINISPQGKNFNRKLT